MEKSFKMVSIIVWLSLGEDARGQGGKQVDTIKREITYIRKCGLKARVKRKQVTETNRWSVKSEVSGLDVPLKLKNSCKMST